MTTECNTLGNMTANFDHARVPIAASRRRQGIYPYFGASGVVDHVEGYIFDGEYLLVSEDGENLRSRSTPIAFIASGKFWVNNHAHVLQGRHGVADTRFIAYALSVTDVSGHLSGSAQPKLSQSSLHRISIPAPPLPEQQAIAEVLGALDDKIAANYTLATKSDGLIRALFVATSQSSDERTIDSICASPRHHVHPSRATGLYVGLEHLPRRHMWLHERGDAAEVASAKSSFERGDVLFGKLRPYFHKVVSAPASGICSTDILVLRAKDPALQGFILAAASSDSVVAAATASSAGTKMPRTSWSDLRACTVPWPEEAGALELSARVMELREVTEAAVRESRTLAQLRDTLLPALMDGTIRVKDAINQAEEVL